MFDNQVMREFTSKNILHDRLREAEQYRLLKRAGVARRAKPKAGLLASIRRLLGERGELVRPTTASG